MELRRVPISEVVPWDKNPRGILKADFERLKRQIRRLGVYKPLVVCEDGGKRGKRRLVVLGGNMRLLALRELGIKEIEVSVVKAPTEKKKIEYSLSDNDRAGYYEDERLAELVYPYRDEIDLGEFKIDLGKMIDLKEVIEQFGPDDNDDADDVPEIDDTPAVTKKGDLFTLGKHRLLCGDSTKAEDMARLMRGEKAAVLITDPPYGVAYRDTGAGAWGPEKLAKKRAGTLKPRFNAIADDELNGQELVTFWTTFLKIGVAQLGRGAPAYCCFASLRSPEVFAAYDAVGLEPRTELVWVKSRPGFNFAHYKHQHEPILYAAQKGQPANWYGDHSQVSTLMVASEAGHDYLHPTQKPVGLLTIPISNSTCNGGIVLDPFLGSGTTLIAAEKTGRVCYGMEIEPKYCDIIIKRYADYVGISEKKIRETREKSKK